ncbi:hypothetical protein AARAC_011573 [Aspergillus arachidicola]|uniref:Uncharacterized protein n=1 Tax=Aspergillus arachidicola TaxID=656916 RepID=A0A2G7G914_9EURO|nr:hypothetical protein AARAC_011573 [Aspergillus arachidicola]
MFASVLGPSSSRSAAQESGQPKALQASPVHIPSTGPEQQLPLPVSQSLLETPHSETRLRSACPQESSTVDGTDYRVHPSRFQVR